jgi:hypothetical protein
MNREVHVRFCEGPRAKLPRPTHPVVCAFGFTHAVLADVVEMSRYPNLGAFWARAEALPAFRAAPPEDGATASAIGD